ncbi:four-carbon acid sugar kinase family protein [bacterium]|nr:four-carbon acid sugar kinase family protein [bacterium]
MITNTNIVGIIADDLTGANDTALQFKLNGADTNILLNENIANVQEHIPQAWAISTESRNGTPACAFEKVKNAVELFVDKIHPDYFYKKIDSTVRGNIAVEVISALEVLDWDAAVIMPAFPSEGRITVCGYQLLNGTPIERTEMAADPHSPISESHLPTMLKNQLGENLENLVGLVELKTVLDGAGPILRKINELIEDGKRIIIVDSVSETDIKQTVLAVQKSDYKILPVGNAAAAKVLSNIWFPNENVISNIKIPKMPKFIVSGSATHITADQIKALEKNCIFSEKSKIYELNMDTIMMGVQDELVERIVNDLNDTGIVLVHTSNLFKNFNGFDSESINIELTKSGLANMITDYLAELTKSVLSKICAILITLGGETSYKCCDALGVCQLSLVDEVLPAIALSKNIDSTQYIVTKSGNLGKDTTIMDILRYFEAHEG